MAFHNAVDDFLIIDRIYMGISMGVQAVTSSQLSLRIGTVLASH